MPYILADPYGQACPSTLAGRSGWTPAADRHSVAAVVRLCETLPIVELVSLSVPLGDSVCAEFSTTRLFQGLVKSLEL